MKLKKDWSLAYLLYYICQIGYWLILINILVQMIVTVMIGTGSTFYVHDIPVRMNMNEINQLDEIQHENVTINIYSSMSATIGVKSTSESNIWAFIYFNGLKVIEAAVYFIVLFFFAKVLKSVAEGRPFESGNSKFLYIIGWTLFMSSILNILIGFIPIPILDEISVATPFEFTSVRAISDYMLEGIFIIVLGYVFKEGARINEEQKLTV